MRELFPFTFNHAPTWFWKSSWAIHVDWLEQEIETHAEWRLPILQQIVGHRNREVHDYVTMMMDTVWDKRICLELYGAYEIKNEHLPDYYYARREAKRKPELVWSYSGTVTEQTRHRHVPLVTQTNHDA